MSLLTHTYIYVFTYYLIIYKNYIIKNLFSNISHNIDIYSIAIELDRLYRSSEMFLSFYKEIIDAQCFLFYISLLDYNNNRNITKCIIPNSIK